MPKTVWMEILEEINNAFGTYIEEDCGGYKNLIAERKENCRAIQGIFREPDCSLVVNALREYAENYINGFGSRLKKRIIAVLDQEKFSEIRINARLRLEIKEESKRLNQAFWAQQAKELETKLNRRDGDYKKLQRQYTEVKQQVNDLCKEVEQKDEKIIQLESQLKLAADPNILQRLARLESDLARQIEYSKKLEVLYKAKEQEAQKLIKENAALKTELESSTKKFESVIFLQNQEIANLTTELEKYKKLAASQGLLKQDPCPGVMLSAV